MNDTVEQPVKETDRLKYTGSKIPLFIKIAWAILIAFTLYYFIQFAVPDLQLWMKK